MGRPEVCVDKSGRLECRRCHVWRVPGAFRKKPRGKGLNRTCTQCLKQMRGYKRSKAKHRDKDATLGRLKDLYKGVDIAKESQDEKE